MLDLAGHHGPGYAFLAEGFDQSRQLPQGEPMHPDARVGRGPGIHLRFGFFFDGCDHNLNPMSARSIEQQKRKSPIAGNQTQLGDRLRFHAAPT